MPAIAKPTLLPIKFLNLNSKIDARNFQILFLGLFLTYGILQLDWDIHVTQLLSVFITCIAIQSLAIYFLNLPVHSIKSALVTSLGLCILLKSNSLWMMVLASAIAIGSKFILRHQGKHFFNPANIGIALTILFTEQAWISPAQWGSTSLLILLIGGLGFFVCTRVQRMDVALAFLGTFFILNFWRSIVYLQWDYDVLIQQFSSGNILLFTFFMITDPVSTPTKRPVRIAWGIAVACLSFYLSSYLFINAAPVWALFMLSFITPLLDTLFPDKKFSWK